MKRNDETLSTRDTSHVRTMLECLIGPRHEPAPAKAYPANRCAAAYTICRERRRDYRHGIGPLYPGNEQASGFIAIAEAFLTDFLKLPSMSVLEIPADRK